MKQKNIFLFFLDNEIHRLFGITRAHGKSNVYSQLLLATKMGILFCEESVLIPASNYFESDYSFKLLNQLSSSKLQYPGIIKLISSSYNIDELLPKKIEEHGDCIVSEGYHYNEFLNPRKQIVLPGSLIKRTRSASRDIKSVWKSDTGITKLGKEVYDLFPGHYTVSEVENLIQDIPDRLGNRAYISRYITPLFNPPYNGERRLDSVINGYITREYIRSFLDEFDAVCLVDIPLLESANIIIPNGYYHVSFRECYAKLQRTNINNGNGVEFLKRASIGELIDFKYSSEYESLFECNVGRVELIAPVNANYKKQEKLKGRYMVSEDKNLTILPRINAAEVRSGQSETMIERRNKESNEIKPHEAGAVTTSILHISDLHFSRNPSMPNMRDTVLDEVREHVQNKPLGKKLLVITGDFHNFWTTDFSDSINYINELIDTMGIEREEDVFLIPGNHDAANDQLMDELFKDTVPEWKKQIDESIDEISKCNYSYIDSRMKSYVSYCQFAREIGAYPPVADPITDTTPARVHFRRWRGKLNILHLNTTLVYKPGIKENQMIDFIQANDPDMWNQYLNNNIPTIVLGHNSFYDLKKEERTALQSCFGIKNVSAYLCGDTHIKEEDLDKVSIVVGVKGYTETIPNIVCAKGVADLTDKYSDFGFYWHEWDETTDKVTVVFRRWRDSYLTTTAPDGPERNYSMKRKNT